MKNMTLIVAMATDNVIGMNNQMPWHMPADLKHFKTITMGKPIIMGRKTFESLGRALPGRQNIVVSSNPHFHAPGATVCTTLESAIAMADGDDVMVIGGAQIFSQALPLANTLYLTLIDLVVEGDTFFPAWDAAEWEEISRESHPPDANNPYAYTFVTLKRH